jgi:hypothetical protein
MSVRKILNHEKQYIVEEWARNPNGAHVRRMWPFQTPKPAATSVRRIVSKWKDYGSLKRKQYPQREKKIATDNMVRRNRQKIYRKPEKSTRCLAMEVGISKTSIHRILQSVNLKPFRSTMVQELLPDDLQKR